MGKKWGVIRFSIFSFLLMGMTSFSVAAPTGKSDLSVRSLKYPNSAEEGVSPVESWAQAPSDARDLTGFTELIPFIHASPDQEEAGSCLYMSLTGIAEWWLARLNPKTKPMADGPYDLSERYLMNIADQAPATKIINNWKTDSIYAYNAFGHGVMNRNYRFTKGWFTEDSAGGYQKASSGTPGAEYGTQINWLDETAGIKSGFVTLPPFRRDVIFADPASDQWNVGVAPADIVERVKNALIQNKAPVHVIYNHMGYWHAVNIVGFDDEKSTNGCKFVTDFLNYMKAEAQRLKDQAAKTTDPKQQQNLLARAQKFERIYLKAQKSYNIAGGCQPKGMFYVRDSIYSNPQQPIYDYDPSQKGDEAPYSIPVILHEYDWLKHLGNHMVQILPQ